MFRSSGISESPGELIGRHTHPGLAMAYFLKGRATLVADGRLVPGSCRGAAQRPER